MYDLYPGPSAHLSSDPSDRSDGRQVAEWGPARHNPDHPQGHLQRALAVRDGAWSGSAYDGQRPDDN